MYKLLAILFLLSISFFSYADDDDDSEPPLKEVIDVSHLNPSPLVMKKSILRVMVANNWIIQHHTKNTIIAQYDNAARVKATINEQTITIEEVKPSDFHFREGWMKSLKHHFIKDATYHHHIEKARSQITN